MNRMIRGAAGLAGPLALVAGLLAATAPSAAASTPVNQSYALNAVGHFSAQTVGQATYSGGSPVILPNVEYRGDLAHRDHHRYGGRGQRLVEDPGRGHGPARARLAARGGRLVVVLGSTGRPAS